MKGTYICSGCSKSLASSQSLWNHRKRCKSSTNSGKRGSGLMHDYHIKPKLHDLMETAGGEKPLNTDTVKSSHHTDEETTGDELSIIDSSSTEDDSEHSENDATVIRSSDEEVHERIDRKLWRIMSLKSHCNERSILPTFKYYVKLCQELHQHKLYKNIMKDVQKIGVGMDFNQALEYVIKNNKDAILKTIAENAEGVNVGKYERKERNEDNEETDSSEEEETDSEGEDETSDDSDVEEYPCKSFWTILLEESLVDDVDMLQGLKQYILLCQSLKDDDVYQVIMKLVGKAMDNQGLDFDGALDYAVEKEKDLIFTARENARREAMLEGKTWATMELI